MDKSLARFNEKIESSSDATTLKKSLYLDADSYFLWLYKVLLDSVLDYEDGYDYSYLSKAFNYLKYTYIKLLFKEKYTDELITLREYYLDIIKKVDLKNYKTFEYIVKGLNNLLEENIKDDNNPLYDLLIKYLFQDLKIEYVSRILSSNPKLLNSKVDDKELFIRVLEEYINSLKENDVNKKNFYLRIINKFLIEDEFILNDDILDNSIEVLESFFDYNTDFKNKTEVNKVIKAIIKRKDLFKLLHITNNNIKEDLDNNIKRDGREVINDYIITIDDDDTFVLDDAISFSKLKNGNILFKVHIADPLGLISFDSNVIKDALSKTSSIYLDGFQLPMIDLSLSADKMSLVKGKERYAKTIFYEFDSSFNLIRVYFKSTIIRVSEKTSFDKINKSYKNGGKNREEAERLKVYDEVLKSIRKELQNINADTIKSEVNIGRHGSLGNFAENLIAYSMVFSGNSMASYFEKRGYPFVYRCHKEDLDLKEDILKHLDKSNNQSVNRVLKGMLSSSKAFYSLTNYGHEALNLSSYSHCTSPLRRFADILNWMIYNKIYIEHINDKDMSSFIDEINQICKYINIQRDTIEDYMHNFVKVITKK